MQSETFQTFNPYTGKTLKEHRHFSSQEVEKNLQEAFKVYHSGLSKSVSDRSQELKKLAQSFRKHAESVAQLMTLEMGKAISDSMAEVEKCAQACDFLSENLEKFRASEELKAHYAQTKIVKDPIGPVLAIMPWNFPLWQVIRFAAPAVGIGNPILLKHSDLTAGTAEKIHEIFAEVSPGLLFNLPISHTQAAAVIADKRVRGVTLTGSARAGREVAAKAGQHLKKSVLELGGSDAYMVFSDSDIEKSAEICAKARMINNGQSCIAAKRFIVEKSALPEFLHVFEKTLRNFKRGDPMQKETQIGTLAAKKFQKQLLSQCLELEKSGAKKVFDLSEIEKFNFEGPDAFFPARIYQVSADLDQAFTEEFFGPVALVFEFSNEKEALALANHSIYGLGGAVFSKDLEKAEKFARQMEAGFIAINDHVKSDARVPFGGVKDSGYGRELGLYGFNEFCNIKSLGFGASENPAAFQNSKAVEVE